MNKLTWHEDLIPPDEVWVKIGGDKGGTSFKMSFQIVNIAKPNSVKNSTVFALFEAPDSVYNLHIALDKYKDVITDLQASMWKSVKIKCLHYCNV